ncbi:MAG: hypothetical protein JNK64_28640 [Myxococcales bacterium]|nr:hypothetical protein [Myxococcales bacterium]
MKRFAFLAIPFAFAACGDNKAVEQPIDAPPVDIDAQDIDARVIDAPPPIDAREIDAPPAVTYSGTISVLEAALLNPGTSGTFFGQGVQIGISFNGSDQVPAPVMEEQPGTPFGCKAWVYDRNQAIAASLGVDEGPVQINSPAGSGTALYPTCSYQAGAGYLCPETATAGAGGTIAAGPAAGTATLTVSGVPYLPTNTTNRYVRITGATNATNNGVFPIALPATGGTIVYVNPGFVAETLPAASTHINLAGIGPTPSAADPGFLLDPTTLDFVHTSGGGGHIATFTHSTPAAAGVGDDFALTAASTTLLNALPRDGSAFTIACDPASCAAGSAAGALLNIVTTNGTPSASPFDMPLPAMTNGRRVQIRCAVLGASGTSVTVPAAYSAFLTAAMTNNATRIQATFIRPTLMSTLNNTNSISGHAIVGFTN